jgi:PKHD-type hydroxylase
MIESSWHWISYFTDKEVDSLCKAIEKEYTLTEGSMGSSNEEIDFRFRSTSLTFVDKQAIPKVWKKVEELVYLANRSAFNFDITKIESCQYGVYKASNKGKYNWHMDTFLPGVGTFDRKISIVVQLTDPSEYEGGDLEFKGISLTDEVKNNFKNKGSVVAFPSFCIHRVTEVTKGVRKSLVFWVEGPAFR